MNNLQGFLVAANAKSWCTRYHSHRQLGMEVLMQKLMTLEETAERLRKSVTQLRWMLHRGTAPKSALIGGRRMFREEDVDAFIEEAFSETVSA